MPDRIRKDVRVSDTRLPRRVGVLLIVHDHLRAFGSTFGPTSPAGLRTLRAQTLTGLVVVLVIVSFYILAAQAGRIRCPVTPHCRFPSWLGRPVRPGSTKRAIRRGLLASQWLDRPQLVPDSRSSHSRAGVRPTRRCGVTAAGPA